MMKRSIRLALTLGVGPTLWLGSPALAQMALPRNPNPRATLAAPATPALAPTTAYPGANPSTYPGGTMPTPPATSMPLTPASSYPGSGPAMTASPTAPAPAYRGPAPRQMASPQGTLDVLPSGQSGAGAYGEGGAYAGAGAAATASGAFGAAGATGLFAAPGAAGAPGARGAVAPGAAAAAPGTAGALASGLGGGLSTGGGALNMLGDQGIINFSPRPGTAAPVSIIRNFALNVTDNNTALPQDRIIPIEYYHFNGSNRVYPGLPAKPNTFANQIFPSIQSRTGERTNDDRYVFGFEKILFPNVSVIVRQSVVTVDPPNVTLQRGTELHHLTNRTGWGDLQISPKWLFYNQPNFKMTTGLGMILPVGTKSPFRQMGNQAFILQPNWLFFATPTERTVIQGGVEYDVPLANNVSGVSLLRWVIAPAYQLYANPGAGAINSIYPMIEFHGSHLLGGFRQTNVNFTVGVRVNVFRTMQFGAAYTTPLTVQNQFYNEFQTSLNIFF